MTQSSKTVVLIISTLKGGGGERSVLTLGQGFYELGYNVHLIRFKDFSEYDLSPHLTYHLVKFKPFRFIPSQEIRHRMFAKALDNYIKNNIGQPDIILSNLEPSDRVMVYSKLPNILYVIRNNVSNKFNIDDDIKSKYLKRIYQTHPCVCVSHGVEKDIKDAFGAGLTTTTIYNPLDLEGILKLASQSISVHDNRLKPDQYLLHVGSFHPQKDHDTLLKAYAASSKQYPLVLLGQGKLMQQTKALAAQLKILDKVIFLGFHKNPYPYIKQARGLILSSRYEGLPRVVIEALALQTPVVSTDCPSGPNELLSENNLVPVADVEALAIKISDLMSQPKRFHVDFSERFLPKNIAQEYVDYVGLP